MLTLVIGGARSGKSRFAQSQARALSETPVYVATARVLDAELQERVRRHQADRGPEWRTIEEPKALGSLELVNEVVVIDCATLWLSNWFFDLDADVEQALQGMYNELSRLLERQNHCIFVTNELGWGPHAETEISRRFVDAQGFLNQELARRASRVVLMVAGIPTVIKETAP
ncbi:MAG: bifunctional adenosylcobinamide kinase/adenosylcobinamide-phosphate guanylyltransferase [Polyangiaceae bacterium]|nr:bifunctional adenosylcobinamide kinase/adenosylcobinamide-phosphate guanylyltransferase [Polyangiaceae bacterium]